MHQHGAARGEGRGHEGERCGEVGEQVLGGDITDLGEESDLYTACCKIYMINVHRVVVPCVKLKVIETSFIS